MFWRKLTDAGLFVSPFTKPAVEKDTVRAVFMATHTDAQIDRALELFERCGRDVGIIPYERPRTRVEVKLARPGATGFLSSAEESAPKGARHVDGGVEIADVLFDAAQPLARRLDEVGEILTWRALNTTSEDVKKLARLPEKLWTQRRRIRSRIISMGMQYMTRSARGRGAHKPARRASESDA
jgi:hypothetical protein